MAEQQNKGMSPLVAGIAGGLIGAAITAGAMALSDPKNRRHADKKVKDLQSWGNQALNEIRTQSGKMTDEAQKSAEELKKASESSQQASRQKSSSTR